MLHQSNIDTRITYVLEPMRINRGKHSGVSQVSGTFPRTVPPVKMITTVCLVLMGQTETVLVPILMFL